MKLSSRMIMLIAVIAAVAVAAPVAMAKGTVTLIPLQAGDAYPSATGKAKYKKDGSNRELEVEVQHIRSLAGKRVNVFVNGNKIGSPLVNRFGNANLNRDTQLGQAVPNIVDGSTVRVKTLGGTLIASGTF
ncbi:MAG: hypothetical protein QOF68_2034 [Gaiellales bacterium]|nr:hypothetical protein [Gaiellales bacterium]